MSKTPNYDAKVKAILDSLTPGERTCELTGKNWYMDEEEIGWYKRFNVPPSPFSPKARIWHYAVYFTVYQWWWNKHFDTSEPVLTYIHPASGIRVLPDKEWFNRDFSEINLDYSVDKPFFDMFRELQIKIPANATRNVVEPENSIATVSLGDKDSFFVSGCKSKNCMYLLDCQEAEGSVDCNAGINITDCYRVNHSSRLHRCKFIFESYDCIDSSFLFDCRNCEFCFGATNKRNKKFIFFNEQLSEGEWRKRVAEINLGNYHVLEQNKKRFYELVENEAVWPENFNQNCENCTGEYLIDCSDCVMSSYGLKSHNNYYCYGIYNARGNAFSCVIPGENNYQQGTSGETANSKFSISLIRCDDLEYSFNCAYCTHCFGCVGLRHKKFHIFNRGYSEEEYWRRVDDLKCAMLERNEYGRPIPAAYTFAYFPESGPVMYLGANASDWDKIGAPRFNNSDEGAFGEMRLEGKEVRSSQSVPENISDLDDSWVGVPIADERIKRPYAFLKPEIEFYKKHNIAPPRQHFTARINELMLFMNTGLMETVACAKCGKKDLIVAVNRMFKKRKFYCRECYLKYLETQG